MSTGKVEVVSTGVEVTVSVGVVDLEESIAVESDIGGADSVPVVDSGVSQPIAAIAKKAMKSMLFMSVTLVEQNGCQIGINHVKTIPKSQIYDTHEPKPRKKTMKSINYQ